MSHPAELPDLFLDRSLGRIVVPGLLRDAGLRIVTLAEHYGVPQDERVRDEEWLELCGSRRWVVFMKDTRVRYNPAERAALARFEVRAFCLSNQTLRGDEMAQRFLVNLPRITRACRTPGPFLYAVHAHRIDRLSLSED